MQVESDRFDLQLVTADETSFASVAGPLAADVSRQLGGAAVEPTYHESAKAPQVGKFMRITALPDDEPPR